MKLRLELIILLVFYFSLISCKKDTDQNHNSASLNNDAITLDSENITQYIKDYQVWAIANEEDLNKKISNIKDKKLLEFSNKVIFIKNKKINNEEYCKIQLPDKNEYWIPKKSLVTKFIVINQADVSCYEQPDIAYINKTKLEHGDFGFYIGESEGWINVDFLCVKPNKLWIGKKWIKEGYTDNLNAAKEAYYLYLAKYSMIIKNNKEDAINYTKKALEINDGEETEISFATKNYLKELESIK